MTKTLSSPQTSQNKSSAHKKSFMPLFFFGLSLGLIVLTDVRLSVALLTGALGMILSGVLSIDEAYEAVSWKTVFLMASLIPLGYAMEATGTAAWLAEQVVGLLGTMPQWILQLALLVLASLFTLVMSNVGATVLLVPIAINLAIVTGGNPALFALLVALAASNAFMLPTHPVNALIIGPGGYRVKDFIRIGGWMSVLYILVVLIVVNLIF